ncbi:hypothetical protein OH799_32935 [Nocardia sp. NBC_00881]|uniref:hypothetical protein n=1 Tax=Nocardia sp. NBC_00881 TaxID=2975995 RepID=UPI0038662A58|nr:hypothetical protein OH799_32935 [Nocardia sp. NBC_00881]
MHIEHEEAMREAFTELDRLRRMTDRPEATEADIHRLYTEGAAIDQGWHYGPHPGEWKFLKEAHSQWACNPSTMRRILASPGADRLDGVQRRSIEQARVLTAAHTRSEIERGR